MWSHLILHSQQSQGIVVGGGGGVEFIDTLARYHKEYSGTVTLKEDLSLNTLHVSL